MNTTIFCRVIDKAGLSFYLSQDGETYFLFNQRYREQAKRYYEKGVSLDKALDRAKANEVFTILTIMDKLPAYIKYIEKEYEIEVFEKTKKRREEQRRFKRCA